jgi:hypothetical protein
MQPLGLNPLTAPVEMTSGIGSPSNPTHFNNIVLDLGAVIQIPVYAGFMTAMDQYGFGLLGQSGFFETFKVTFDHALKLYYLETRQ